MHLKLDLILLVFVLGISIASTHPPEGEEGPLTPHTQEVENAEHGEDLPTEASDDGILNEESDVKPVFESDLPGEPSESPKYSTIASFHSGDDIDGEGQEFLHGENETADIGNSTDQNGTLIGNGTELEISNSTANSTKPVKTTATCILRSMPKIIELNDSVLVTEDAVDSNVNLTEAEAEAEAEVHDPILEIVNVTQLIQDVLWTNASIKNRSTPANCSIVLFYAAWCPFSAKAAPHFNALARAFPDLRVAAIDSSLHSSVNSYFGILSVPTILFFHNGKTLAKFNDTSFTLNKFADFIQSSSELKSDENINVTSQDFIGPLPSTPSKDIDIWLVIAWIFIIICFFHYASKSIIWKKVIDLVRTTWREAEDQHEHAD